MRTVLLFLYDEMADFEITLTAYALATEGFDTVPIGYNDTVKSRSGIEYRIRTTVREAHEMDGIAGLLIPGGYRCDLRKELVALIQKLDKEKKLLAAICAGPQYLARAGVLNDRSYTTSLRRWTEEDAQRFGGDDPFPRETFRPQRVVRDGHIITAYGDAFVDFTAVVCDSLGVFRDPSEKDAFLRDIKGC